LLDNARVGTNPVTEIGPVPSPLQRTAAQRWQSDKAVKLADINAAR
jgi:hypothetical protein